MTTTYDTAKLTQLGRRLQRIRAELAAVRPEIAEEIRTAHAAGVTQVDIVKATGYTRDAVRLICLSPQERRHARSKQQA